VSVEQQPAGGPPSPQFPLVVLMVTVVSFVAVIILGVAGEPVAAGVIGSVWAATCTLLATRQQ
jgi:hypothetical protein